MERILAAFLALLLSIMNPMAESVPMPEVDRPSSGPPEAVLLEPMAPDRSDPPTDEAGFVPVFIHAMSMDGDVLELDYPMSEWTSDGLRALVRSAWQEFFRYYPEYSMYRRCKSFRMEYENNTITLVLTFVDMDGIDRSTLAESLAMAYEVHESLSSQPGWDEMSEMDRARLMAEWVAGHMDYDHSGDPAGATAWHGFAEGTGVCAAYVGMYNLLLRLDGIECRGRYGSSAGNAEHHVWTLACLDGTWYNIDPTFCDQPKKFYDKYFAKPDSEFASTHSWLE